MKWRHLVLTAVAVSGLSIVALGVSFFYPAYKFESWVASRLEIFAETPYESWEELHAACAELAAHGKQLSAADYAKLPDPIKTLEPKFVWVEPDRVTLKFSGGHSRFVVIEYRGDRFPTELELFTENFFEEFSDGVVFPRSDQRPIGLHQRNPESGTRD